MQENISLAPLTTLKIGGKARFFAAAETEIEVVEAVRFTQENDLNLFVLGGGSNVLISDGGFDGLVLHIALQGISINAKNNDTVFITAQAGEDWDGFVNYCVEENLAGVECLSGIPGLIGGTPVQNVGAYGQEVSETIIKVRVFDRKSNEILELTNADCGFAYRASIFNTTEKNRFVVLAVTFALKKDSAPKIIYKDLREFFGVERPTLAETRQAVLQIRRAKSMVIDEQDANSKSAGSFFKNPIISGAKLTEIIEMTGIENMPFYKTDENNVKIPAAWLIENAGFQKGFQFGSAGLSTNHTLALVNRANATAKDILSLRDEIQAKVKEKFSVELQTEPIFVGLTEN